MSEGADIILVGASVRSLAESAIADGLSPFCVDMFADADLEQTVGAARIFRIRTPAEVVSVLPQLPARAPMLITGGIENEQTVLNDLRTAGCCLLLDLRGIGSVRDPAQLFAALQHADVAVPAWRTNALLDDRDWLIKNGGASGGLHVTAITVTQRTQKVAAPFYAQERINGVCVSATFLSNRDGESIECRMLGAALQLSGCEELHAPGFAYCGNAGPLQLSMQLQQQIEHAGRVVAQQFLLRGLFGIDCIVAEGKVFVIEVNPRITASHELHEHCANEPMGHVALQSNSYGKAQSNFAAIDQQSGAQCASPSSAQRWLRVVFYNRSARRVTESMSAELLGLCRRVSEHGLRERLADIPFGNQDLLAGTPFCSGYLPLSTDSTGTHAVALPDWLDPLAAVLSDSGLRPRLSGLMKRVQMQIAQLAGDR